jgi:hypothetical protein
MKEQEKTISTLEVEVSIKALDKKSGKLAEFYELKSKAIKSKTPEASVMIKDSMEIRIDEFVTEEGASFPAVVARCGSKLTKADAGRI